MGKKWGTCLALAFACLLTACATVDVIAPVATQNERNATALAANIETLVSLTDQTLPALLDVSLIDGYRDTMLAIRKSKFSPRKTREPDIVEEHRANAESLRGEIDGLDADLRPAQIEQSYRSYPLTAQVAFGGMSPKDAAAIWLALESTYAMLVPDSKKFELRMNLIKGLHVIAKQEQGKKDVLSAYQELRGTILQQAGNAQTIAAQFREASQSARDPNALLKGVVENPKILDLIGESVARRTGDPDRRKAAEALLSSVMGGSGLNSGK